MIWWYDGVVYKMLWYLTCMILILGGKSTRWWRDNMTAILQMAFSNAFFYENIWISSMISLKFIPKRPININPALVKIMAWRRPDDKPLSESSMVNVLMHICTTRPQWINDANGVFFTGIIFTQCMHVCVNVCVCLCLFVNKWNVFPFELFWNLTTI